MTLSALQAALADRYRLERELGAGGMATVYLAQDLKHDRRVAIKVLRPELAAVLGAERFVQEIKTTAALSHPHILPLFDSGTADGQLYYVMPYIEGETIREKLNRETQFGIDEAVRITREVADALDYAHRHGVIHRDIKPENILLHDGRAMVMDFGIALAVSAAAGGRMTETGLSLGTPHYMSPEQATADRDITARSDIYSLGSVLYEMLSGEPPHLGTSAQQIIMKIVTEDAAPVTRLRKSVPPNVGAAVAQSLEKLPADRFSSARQFHDALGDPGFTTARSAPTGIAAVRDHTVRWLVGALAVVAVLAAWGWLRPAADEVATSRNRVTLWDDDSDMLVRSSDGRNRGNRVALAPDGSSIVFRSTVVGDGGQLMRKPRNEANALPMAGTDGAISPVFSPDGDWVAFLTPDGALKKVPAGGGGAVTLATNVLRERYSAAWLDDDRIAYFDTERRVRLIPATGGEGVVAGPLEGNIAFQVVALPGSRGLLISSCETPCSRRGLHVLDLASSEMRELLPDAQGGWYSPSGHLLYVAREGGLFAVPFDLDRLEVQGGAVPVIDGVRPWEFTLSASGEALYGVGTAASTNSRLVSVTREGALTLLDSAWVADFHYPALSPDGSRLAVTITEPDGPSNIWLRERSGGRRKHTFEGTTNWRPSWSGDGRSVMYVRSDGPGQAIQGDLWTRGEDGSQPAAPVLDVEEVIWEGIRSGNGEWLVFRTNDGGTNANVYARRTRGDTTVLPIVVSANAMARGVALSPDSRWLAYTSDESGQYEVYVISFPDGGARQLVSRDGGTEPRWRADGRELFFRARDQVMAVPVQGGSRLAFGDPVALFTAPDMVRNFNRHEYDVSADGRRFIMVQPAARADASDLVLVENLVRELRERLP